MKWISTRDKADEKLLALATEIKGRQKCERRIKAPIYTERTYL